MEHEPDLSTRIQAARLLRGVSKDELNKRLVDAGISLRAAQRLQVGKQEPVQGIHLFALSKALRFPERWFEAPVDELCTDRPTVQVEAELSRIAATLEDLVGRLGP